VAVAKMVGNQRSGLEIAEYKVVVEKLLEAKVRVLLRCTPTPQSVTTGSR